eukprot:7383056-Prymnesium_polylepis.1
MGTCWMDRVGCLESGRSRSSRSTRPHAVHCYSPCGSRSARAPTHHPASPRPTPAPAAAQLLPAAAPAALSLPG